MKKSTFWAVCVTAVLFLCSYQVGWGQLYVDNFSYTVGTALSANGWNVTGTTASPLLGVTASSITYPGYLSSGIGDEVSLAVSGEDVNHTFTSQTAGTVYASCLVNVTSATATGDYFFLLGASTIGTTYHGRVFIKKDPASANFAFGISRAGAVGTAILTPYSYSTGTTYLLVLKYSIVAGTTNDVAELYINPTLNSVEPVTGWITATDAPNDLANIGSVGLRQGGSSSAAALKLDGVRVGTTWADIVGPAAGVPIITAAPTSLTGFNYVIGSGPSAAQTFTVSGSSLTNNISIAASTNFEISLSSTTGYTTPIVLTQTGGTVASTTIYARLKAGLPAASYSAEALNITSTGATSQSVTCFGIVNPLGPVINVGTITAFGNQTVNTLSATKTYNVSGSNLTNNIIVTAPAGFQISLTNDPSFASGSPITLTQTGGSVASTPIYVKFAPTSAIAYSANITHTSTGATLQNVAVSGTGTAGEPTNHVTNFTAGAVTSTSIPLTWTDASGGTVPDGYLIKASPANYNGVSDPFDGTPEADAALVKNIAQGIGNYTFTGLNSGTPYFFKIYPYTNSGTAINYLTTAPVPQVTATTTVVPYLALYEDFNYTPPAFIGGNTAIPSSSNNWETHSGGSGTIDVQNGNLSFAGLATPSGYMVRLPGNNSICDRDVNRAMTVTPNTSAVMYYSALINVVDNSQLADLVTSDYFIHFNAQSGSTASTIYGARLAVKAVNTFANYRLSIKNTSGTGQTFTDVPTDLNFGQTYMVVVKYDRSTSPTTASLWVDPISLGGTEPAGATVNASGDGTFLQFGSISLRNSSTTPKVDIDEIRIGTTWADVTPPGVATLAATPTSLSDFIYFAGSGPSPSQSFTVTGTALSPTSGTLTVSGSTNYEVSANNVTFGASASIAYSVATFTSDPVYVRLKAGLGVGTYNGQIINISGGGAASNATVTCNGSVAAANTPIIIIPGSLTTFGNQAINTPSAEKTYSVSGSFLTGNIIITPPVGFEISITSGSGFVTNPSTIVLPQSGGTVVSTPIFVRFNPSLLQAYSGNIIHASTGALNVNVAVSGVGIKGEPTNFPTLFAAGTPTSVTIPLTWTDATTGTFVPDGYLIKGSAVSFAAITDPSDLVAEANSALVQNVAQGVQTFTFGSLIPGGTYYFKIFPFTNSGAAIDYKTLFAPQTSAQTLPPPVATYTWNQIVAGSWAVAANWTPPRTTPALNDILVVNGTTTPTATINSIPTQTIAQLNIINSATANLSVATSTNVLTIAGATVGADLVVEAGSSLNLTSSSVFNLTLATGATAIINGNMTVSGGAHKFTSLDASGITFKSGSLFTTGAAFTGNPFGIAGTGGPSSVVFESGSTFLFTTGSNPFVLTSPASIVIFQTGSLYKHQGTNSPSFAGRTYANVEFNIASTFTLTGTTSASMDNLTVTLGTVNCNFTTDPGHSIKGNIVVATGAALTFTPTTAGTIRFNGTSAQSITLIGTGTFTTGALSTIEINNAAGVTFNNSISILGGLKFTNGLLNLGANNLTLGAASAITGTPSASSMIVASGAGELRKTFAATGSFTYPVGDNTVTAEYSPVTLNFTAGTFAAAYAGVKLTNAVYGASANQLKRYWDLSSSGITSFTCDALFDYVPADVLGTEGSIYCVRISPAANFAVANTTLHQLSATGVTEFGTFTGQDQLSTSKTLTLTSVFLEGLYAGNGTMNTAALHVPPFGAGVADLITVELHDPATYLLAVSIPDVQLSTTGTATVTVPSAYNGSYHITIRHRNSVETTTLNPVSFAGSTINQAFTVGNVYGGNLGLMAGPGTYYAIYAGDVDQNGSVDSGDFTPIDNDVTNYASGYLATDVNGDGSVDTGDFTSVDNNGLNYVGTVHP